MSYVVKHISGVYLMAYTGQIGHWTQSQKQAMRVTKRVARSLLTTLHCVARQWGADSRFCKVVKLVRYPRTRK